jgi:hypothetical protein
MKTSTLMKLIETSAMKSPTLAGLMASAYTRECVEEVQAGTGQSDLAMLYAFWFLDHKLGGKIQTATKIFDNEGRDRGTGLFLGVEYDDAVFGDPKDFIEAVIEAAESDVRHKRVATERAALAQAGLLATPPKPKKIPKQPLSMSREARRKRQARAAGRVKPRPRKPTRTVAMEVESRLKAIATRQAQLEALMKLKPYDFHDTVLTHDAIARMRASLGRARKALKTYRWRLAHPKEAAEQANDLE